MTMSDISVVLEVNVNTEMVWQMGAGGPAVSTPNGLPRVERSFL